MDHSLQRLIVRMHYDPQLVDQIYDRPAKSVGGFELDSTQRGWLVAGDRRAYKVDFYRRSRSLTELLEEYPVSCSLVIRQHGDAKRLDAFFSSSIFHESVQQGHSLSLSFGAYLRGLLSQDESTWLQAILNIESGVARARRSFESSDSAHWMPWRCLVEAPTNALQKLVAAKQLLGGADRARILDVSVGLGFSSPPDTAVDYLLIRVIGASDGDAQIEQLPFALYELLAAAERGSDWDGLRTICGNHDATAKETDEILDELLVAGDLRR